MMMVLAFNIAACTSQSSASSSEINRLKEQIGETKDIVFKNLELEDGKDIELYKDGSGVYEVKEEQKLYGEPLKLALTFDIGNDKMYGFRYLKAFEDNKDSYDFAKKMFADLSKSHGEPSTYPGMTNRISEMPGYEDLSNQQNAQFLESWKVEDGLDVELRMVNS